MWYTLVVAIIIRVGLLSDFVEQIGCETAIVLECFCSISTKHIRPGGIALSEWMPFFRASGDNLVQDSSAPCINPTSGVADRPPIAITLCRLVLFVFYCKQTLWRCGQLRPSVGMGSLGTKLYWDCDEMGDNPKLSLHVPSTFRSRRIGTRWKI